MYIFCIIMIAIASILLILAVLVQSPKSGMAANFGAANQTMGVRQTTDFLEKFTWAMIAAIVFFSLLAATAAPKVKAADENVSGIEQGINSAIEQFNAPAEDVTLDAATLVGETDVTVEGDTDANISLDAVQTPEIEVNMPEVKEVTVPSVDELTANAKQDAAEAQAAATAETEIAEPAQ